MKKLSIVLIFGLSLSLLADVDEHYDFLMPEIAQYPENAEAVRMEDRQAQVSKADQIPNVIKNDQTDTKQVSTELVSAKPLDSDVMLATASIEKEEILRKIEQRKKDHIVYYGETNWYKTESAIQLMFSLMGLGIFFAAQQESKNKNVNMSILAIGPALWSSASYVWPLLFAAGGFRAFYCLVESIKDDFKQRRALNEDIERINFLEIHMREIQDRIKARFMPGAPSGRTETLS